jgi:hypothetical protein
MRGETCDRPATPARRHLAHRGGMRDVRERLRGEQVARDLVPRGAVRQDIRHAAARVIARLPEVACT